MKRDEFINVTEEGASKRIMNMIKEGNVSENAILDEIKKCYNTIKYNAPAYDYIDSIKNDIKEYIDENVDLSKYHSFEDAMSSIYHSGYNDFTGLADSSKTMNRIDACDNLFNNEYLLIDLITSPYTNPKRLDSIEMIDVSIREKNLYDCLKDVIVEKNEDEKYFKNPPDVVIDNKKTKKDNGRK